MPAGQDDLTWFIARKAITNLDRFYVNSVRCAYAMKYSQIRMERYTIDANISYQSKVSKENNV